MMRARFKLRHSAKTFLLPSLNADRAKLICSISLSNHCKVEPRFFIIYFIVMVADVDAGDDGFGSVKDNDFAMQPSPDVEAAAGEYRSVKFQLYSCSP